MNVDERLAQVRKDKKLLEQEEKRLLKEKAVPLLKVGGVYLCFSEKRFIVTIDGKYFSVDVNGQPCAHISNLDDVWLNTNYKYIGQLKDFSAIPTTE